MRYSFFLALLLALTVAHADDFGKKRFIGHSWDLLWVNTQDLVRNQEALEKLPLEGISISIYAKNAEGKQINLRSAMTQPPWERSWFEEEISRVKQISSGKFKHNLICTYWAPRKRLAWNDDTAWANAAHNMAIAAWIAREGGAKGLLIDPEDYPKSQQYTLLPEDGSYEETAALARRRGAQMMQAMAAEYPDITLLAFWFFSMNRTLYQRKVDLADYAHSRDILWPHFLNGFLDAIPPGAIMVDATEHGYQFKAADMDFYLSAWEIAKCAPMLVAPENRAKYRNQVQAGFGLYLDMYTNDEKSFWYFGPLNGSRLNHLRSNFTQASRASDQYCWVYGEKFRWIKWDWRFKDRDAPTWEEKLPGFERTLALITDPDKVCRQIVDEGLAQGTLVNLVTNPDCSPLKKGELKDAAADWTAGNLPEGWSFWRYNEKQGSFGFDTTKGLGDNYSARATGVSNGCFIVRTPATPGNTYIIEGYSAGEGSPSLRARWQKEGRWVVPNKDVIVNFDKSKDPSVWRRAIGFVDVPPEADSLILLMGTNLAPNQTAWFDKPGIYHLQ
ncbi:MAG: hypothetical protein GX937_09050 [Lentisphaerae bacterium]|nr:hypothetical protein [Lentisphaerota bacterium]